MEGEDETLGTGFGVLMMFLIGKMTYFSTKKTKPKHPFATHDGCVGLSSACFLLNFRERKNVDFLTL